MSIFDKAKEVSEKISEKAIKFSSDEMIADTILRAVEKQEKVNAILQARGSTYRIADLEIGMGIPPSVTFGIRRIGDGGESIKVSEAGLDSVSDGPAPSEP